MPKPITTPVRAALNALIEQLGQPDLATEQGRLDYRTLILTKTARDILDLPGLNDDAAVFLYQLMGDRLQGLLYLKLLSETQYKALLDERAALFERLRPELLPRLLECVDHV